MKRPLYIPSLPITESMRRPRRCATLAWTFLILALLVAGEALSYEYHGSLLSGGYLAREDITGESEVNTDNDRAVFSGRAYLDVNRIGSQQYQFTADLRDKHDFFDKIDTQRLQLSGKNTPRLRQLVVRNPGTSQSLYWSVGRFLPAENNVIYNDGLEGGIHLSTNHKVGLFAGYRPKINEERAANLGSNAYQTGIYHVYQNDASSWDEGKYLSNILVYAPQYFDDQPTPTMAFINQGFLHLGADNRLLTYLNIQGTPDVRVEDAKLEFDKRFNPKLSTRFITSRIDLIEYRNQRDILERLPPTAYSQAKIASQYRLNGTMRLDGNLLAGQREGDRLRKYEMSCGANFTKLAAGHVATSILFGARRSFISRDLFAASTINWFTDTWLIDANLRVTRQQRDSGVIRNQYIIGSNLGLYATRSLLATAGAELAKDENITIVSGLLTIGYRFGSRELTPLRDVAPPNTRF